MNPRPYQLAALEAVKTGFEEHSKQLVVLPTGSGKTCLFSWMAEETKGRTLVLAHREELIDQAIEKLHKTTGIYAGKEKAEFKASHSHGVVVASVQSMIRRLDRWPADHFDLVVCDEAHHSISKSWLKVLNHFDDHANVLGVTATPDRGDKRNLGVYYENIAFEVSMLDLVRDGYLSPITIKTCPIKLDIRGVHKRAGDYDAGELGESLTPYLEQIADAILEHAAFKRTLVFLPLIATSKAFVEICRSKGIIAEHIDGYSADRKEKLAAFANGQFDLMSNAMLLTEGFDDPGIECVVNLRPTQSRSLFAQIIGRGTRPAAGKENLLLLDFLWQHEKHNLIRPAHLIAESDEIADIMTEISEKTGGQGELDLEGLASDAQVQREKKLREIIKEREHEESKLLDAMDFCSQMGDSSPGWENTKQWHSRGITSSQEKILTKAGINLKSVKGKGHAAKLIDLYFKHEGAKPASDKQRAAMKRASIPNAENATRAEAKQFFAMRNKHRAA